MLLIVLLSIVLSFTNIVDGYYFSHNILRAKNASNYCQQHCGSNLLSIHSLQEHSNAVDFVNTQKKYADLSDDIWIGLRRNLTDGTFYWTDGSVFNYGTDLSGSVEPWKRNKPLPLTEQRECVLLNKDQDKMLWNDFNCNNRKHFLCNDCDSVLNKYIIPNIESKYNNAGSDYCEQLYNTSLANIYNENDMENAQFLCSQRAENISGCWIGKIYNLDITFDMNKGIFFNAGSDYSLDTVDNDNQMYNPMCNALSEICKETEWKIIEGIDWDFTIKPCEIIHKYDINIHDNEIKLNSKEWMVLLEHELIIELVYAINEIDVNECEYCGEAGLMLYTSSNLYYIGISYNGNSIFLIDLTVFSILANEILDFKYEFGVFYPLTIELLNNTISVFINNYEYILYDVDINIERTMIGIKHSKSSVIIKSLFVSGIAQIVSVDNIHINDTKCNIGSMICSDGSLIGKDISNSCDFFKCPTQYNVIIIVDDLDELDTDEITNIVINTLLAENTNINILSTEIIDNSVVILFSVPANNELDKDVIGKHIEESLEEKYDQDFDVSIENINENDNTKDKKDKDISDETVILMIIIIIILVGICAILIFCVVRNKKILTNTYTESNTQINGEKIVRVKSISNDNTTNIQMETITNGMVKNTNDNNNNNNNNDDDMYLMRVQTPQSNDNVIITNGKHNNDNDNDNIDDDGLYNDEINVTDNGENKHNKTLDSNVDTDDGMYDNQINVTNKMQDIQTDGNSDNSDDEIYKNIGTKGDI